MNPDGTESLGRVEDGEEQKKEVTDELKVWSMRMKQQEDLFIITASRPMNQIMSNTEEMGRLLRDEHV